MEHKYVRSSQRDKMHLRKESLWREREKKKQGLQKKFIIRSEILKRKNETIWTYIQIKNILN